MGVLALLWGSGFLWIKISLNEGLTPGWITFLRCALGAAVLLVLARAAGQRLPRDRATWGRLAVAAFFCNALPFLLFSVGEQTVDSGVAGVLNATTPLWSLLIGLALGTERPLRAGRATGLALGFAGVLVIFAPWDHGSGLMSLEALALLGASVSYAVAFAYMARHLAARGTAPLALSAAQLLAATGLSTPALAAGGAGTVTWAGLLAVAALGVLATGLTFHLNYRMIAEEGPTAAATVGYLLPVVSVGLGALVLGEPLTARVVAGMAVVLVGVGLARPRRRPGRAERTRPTKQARPDEQGRPNEQARPDDPARSGPASAGPSVPVPPDPGLPLPGPPGPVPQAVSRSARPRTPGSHDPS
ncbi:DMT family transporter [Streptomyces sp. adm13(2018)]|nr:DMT family transporter [Streptomyces sp. adm13(2018)]TXS21267.1 DMT family transporter [Streptomyces sp. adm13(2018)]